MNGPRGFPRAAAALLLALAAALPAGAQRPGSTAPDFTLVDADGEPVTLAELRGRPVVLNFWASWCAPCRAELPVFAAAGRTLADAAGADGGATPPLFVMVNLDDAPAAGRAFLAEVLGDVPEAMLPVYTPSRERRAELRAAGHDALTTEGVARRYRVLGYPTTVAVDAGGVIVAVRPGELRRADLRELLAAVGVSLPRSGWRPRRAARYPGAMSDEPAGPSNGDDTTGDTIFARIVRREIPADILYQDDLVTAFRDINPRAPTHVLIVPNEPVPSAAEVAREHEPALGRMFTVARELAEREGLERGYRLMVNCGEHGHQEVFHLHMHLFGGRPLGPMLCDE